MSTRTCAILAVFVALCGVGLRGAIPVTPVDGAFRDLLSYYGSLKKPEP